MHSTIKAILCGLWLAISASNLTGQQEELPFQHEIRAALAKSGVSNSAMAELRVSDRYHSRSMDIEHVYYQQYFEGIPVENAILNSGFRNDQLVYANNTFVKSIKPDPSAFAGIQPPTDGLTAALTHLNRQHQPIPIIKSTQKTDKGHISKARFDKGTISRNDIEVSLVWVPEGKKLRLCWQSIIDVADSHNEYYYIMTDARSGEFIKKHNLVIECNFDHIECAEDQYSRPVPERKNTRSAILANTYNVFDFPLESPNHGPRTITSSPWNRPGGGNPATTLGWHNDGTSNYTITRGNNVYAYEDQDNNNLPGYAPDGGVSLDFNFPFDPSMPPSTNVDAAITNLFHTCNLIHDIMYQYGFDEPAGNFQTDNLGRGGDGGDHVLAEGLDGGGTNNANFATPADGSSGRMQMFLWSDITPPPDVVVNTPLTLDSPIPAVESVFSTANKLIDVGPVTQDVVLVNDLSGGSHEACSANPIANGGSISGKIALIDRGNCDFTEKVKNAQDLGAVAAIVVNNNPLEGPIAMGGTDNTITIPAIMISFDDGQAMKEELLVGTVNITMTGGPVTTPDGSYDNGIIIHEYGHGISTRLTGGPSLSGCLSNDEQMGEGWSDFFTLMLATDWNAAVEDDRRGIGTYVQGEPTNGTGIRTYPYTTDILVNPFTYGDVASAPVIMGQVSPHYIGSIWATMLWDMTWNIIEIEGAGNDLYHGTAGNNIALQLVTDGLKLQNCQPGFVDGRDAILKADEIRYGGRYKCAIWEAFARRGLGVSAIQGSSGSYTDGVEAFDIPDGVILSQTTSSSEVYEGEIITVNVEGVCECVPKNNYQVKHNVPEGYEVISISQGSQSGSEVLSPVENLNPLDTVRLRYDLRTALCSASTDNVLFTDNIEGNEMFDGGKGNKKWVVSNLHSNSPTNSWYAQDYSTSADITLTLNSEVLISGPTILSFTHRFQTEATWDGGVVEISINNGSSWEDLGDHFILNGYPSAFASNANNALAGREAFTGDGDVFFGTSSFVRSEIDLCGFAGENILIRFRLATDDNTAGSGINGWYVDDISITHVSGIINKGYICQGVTTLDSVCQSLRVSALNQNLLYVDVPASGSRHGGDWANAFNSLQDALKLAECRAINTIYLAEGTYLPFDQRDSSFMLLSDVAILGGFPTGGSALASRDPATNLTILSGDIGANGSDSDNSYHVVYCGAGVTNALLDGVIIEKGNANGGGIDNEGSAILNLGLLTLKDVITRQNTGNSQVHNGVGSGMNIDGNNKIGN